MNVFFITGTDTDSGKTTVSAAILAYLATQQKRVLGLKPIASGCLWQAGQWHSEDAAILAAQSTITPLPSPWRFSEPIAPHIAASKAKCPIALEDLTIYIEKHANLPVEYLLVEGAGGLLVPIELKAETTWLDVVNALDLPVILVVGLKLGCINHALLTLAALKHAGRPAVGWIANHLTEDFAYAEDNIAAISALAKPPLLGVCHHGGDLILNDFGKGCFV